MIFREWLKWCGGFCRFEYRGATSCIGDFSKILADRTFLVFRDFRERNKTS